MGNLNIFDKNHFRYGRNFFTRTKYATKEFFRRTKFAKQRVQDGFAACDLWDMEYYLMDLLESSLTKFLSIEDKGIPVSIFYEELEKTYEKHRDEFEHSKDEFFCLYHQLTPTEVFYYRQAEDEANSRWNGIISLMIKYFHDANPHNEKEVKKEYGFGDAIKDDVEYAEFKHMQMCNGFDLLKDYMSCLGW